VEVYTVRLQHLVTVGVLLTASPAFAAQFPKTLDEAEKMSQETGRPMLIVAGSAT